jgi:chitodextrinase
VPYLFNPSTGIWISYDDVESINIKNNYIKQKRLGGAFFWELSCDRQAELINTTFNALSKGNLPSSTSSPIEKNQSWKVKMNYKVGHRLTYQGKTYRCIKAHRSVSNKTPALESSLWHLETVPTLPPTTEKIKTTATEEVKTTATEKVKKTATEKIKTTAQPSNQDSSSHWKSFKSYSVGDQVTYEEKTYRCRQSHTSLSDWMPPAVPALWLEI